MVALTLPPGAFFIVQLSYGAWRQRSNPLHRYLLCERRQRDHGADTSIAGSCPNPGPGGRDHRPAEYQRPHPPPHYETPASRGGGRISTRLLCRWKYQRLQNHVLLRTKRSLYSPSRESGAARRTDAGPLSTSCTKTGPSASQAANT